MKMQQYTMIFSSATLLLALTSQSSLAFSITGSKTGSSLTKISPNNFLPVLAGISSAYPANPILRSDFRKT